ncbi:MAG: class I SAM-dependent methyltransferase [Amphiplicatus sp.]
MQNRLNASLKQRLVALARHGGALPLLERVKYLRARSRSADENRAYLAAHPGFDPPPLWWMHDMYSHASYALYMATGLETAAAIAQRIDRHCNSSAPRVADWGCGLARVLRHLPRRYSCTGFDYNRTAIDWCAAHVSGAEFYSNGLAPPLPAEAGAFNALYALSVFTHLSAEGHSAWISEIARVLASGGVFLGAFHMTPAKGQLLPDEQKRFDCGELVIRGGVKEGGRTFTAYHPERYVRDQLLAGFDIVEEPEDFFGQSLIVARKRR